MLRHNGDCVVRGHKRRAPRLTRFFHEFGWLLLFLRPFFDGVVRPLNDAQFGTVLFLSRNGDLVTDTPLGQVPYERSCERGCAGYNRRDAKDSPDRTNVRARLPNPALVQR